MKQYTLCDIWRIRNESCKRFTWRSKSPIIQRRLDFFLISSILQPFVQSCKINPAIETDHSAVDINFKSYPKEQHGPSFWKFNNSLLSDQDYITEIRNKIRHWSETYINKNNSQMLWEYLKFKIREYTIKYSKQKSRKFRAQLHNQEIIVRQLESNLMHDSTDSQKKEYFEEKRILEKLYDNITKGNIVRSRAKWVEEGEKSSKYFLNLEKQNKAKSVIRKLLINNKEVTNPKEILHRLETFYMNKYTKCPGITGQGCKDYLKDINLPKLDHDDSNKCNGYITLSEIHKALLEMKSNKTPGNDGLTTEFYLSFFTEIGLYLLNSINAAYENNNLSTTQKQAVINLLEKKGRDTRDIKTWRPISLLNVDVKVISKVLVK